MIALCDNKKCANLSSFPVYSKVLTAADDTIMKVFTVGADAKTLEECGDPIDLEGETFTISSDQVDTIAIGGDDKKVYLYKLKAHDDGTLTLDEASKDIAMCFDTPVMKVEFCAGGKLLAVAQDSHVQVMDTETKKVTSFV